MRCDNAAIRYAGLCILPAILGLLAACAPSERVVFVTSTNIGINTDNSVPALSVGFDRVEGVVGPVDDKGNMPGVFAYIDTNGGVFERNVRQLYATGKAASAIVKDKPSPSGDAEYSARTTNLGFFGTETVVGMKIGLPAGASTSPTGFTFGARRRELSMLPVGPKLDTYPSTLAMLDTSGAVNGKDASFGIVQFFAAGEPAQILAGTNSDIRSVFRQTAEDALTQRYSIERVAQSDTINDVLSCYQNVPTASKPDVWNDADQKGLFQGNAAVMAALTRDYQASGAPGTITNAAALQNADGIYRSIVSVPNAISADWGKKLIAHRDFVCAKAKS